MSERERQRRKRDIATAAERDVTIPIPSNSGRRLAALADVFLFLSTYFPETFCQEFTPDRRAMVKAIIHAATFSGDTAIAGPRGEGKTQLAMHVALWLILRGTLRLPVVVGKNQKAAENELTSLKAELTYNELLREDFPEVCCPIAAIQNWSSRAKLQTTNGHLTRIIWAQDHIIFPTVPRGALPEEWPDDLACLANGQGLCVVGIDGRIRGLNVNKIRPDLAIIDDVDSRESASSEKQTADRIIAIDSDIAGLAGSGKRIARVMLCTTINRTCIAFLYTDRVRNPAWNGRRYAALPKLPDRIDLWDEYVELRRNRDPDTDPDARVAHKFYIKNRREMDAGAEVSNPDAFEGKPAADGKPLQVSALQRCYDLIADLKWDPFCTEYQNDPPEGEEVSKAGITRQLVESRISGFVRGELPPDSAITVGIDIGKYSCHWVAIASRENGAGAIVNYGIIEVQGTEGTDQQQLIERAILRALCDWRDGLAEHPFRDADGSPVEPSMVLIDSGYCPDAVKEFVQRYGDPYRSTKGISGNFRHGTPGPNRRVGNHWFSTRQSDRQFWLYNLDADHWKRAVHHRFISDPFDENNLPTAGSLTLFIPAGNRDHRTFGAHILAEEFITEFIPGKGERSRFVVHSANNHLLDATAMALAGAEMAGRGLFANSRAKQQRPRMSLREMAKGNG